MLDAAEAEMVLNPRLSVRDGYNSKFPIPMIRQNQGKWRSPDDRARAVEEWSKS